MIISEVFFRMESEYSQDYQSGCPSKLACSSVQGLSIPLSTGGGEVLSPPHREVNQDPIFSFGRGVMVVSLVEVTFIIVVFVWSSLLLRIAAICMIFLHMG